MSTPSQFWETFGRLKDQLVEEGRALGETYDALLDAVQKVRPGLYLEMCLNTHPKEFIISAEGSRELFPAVEEIVRAAPKIDGWTFLALKPKLGFPVTAEWEGVEVRIADVTFKPIGHPDGTMGLHLFVRGLRPEQAGAVHNALLRALDHGLGERAFAEQIEGTQIAATPGWLKAAGLIPLTDLEEFLRKRASSR